MRSARRASPTADRSRPARRASSRVPAQREMAAAVAGRLETAACCSPRPGTGTGKTLAYLVPAILSRERVLVSTGTKNLQEQIFFKDLPVLERALGVPFKRHLHEGPRQLPVPAPVRALRGRQRRGHGRGAPRLAATRRARMFVRSSTSGPHRTETGDRAELDDLPEDLPLWNDIAATAENCLGTRLPALSTTASSRACASARPNRTW